MSKTITLPKEYASLFRKRTKIEAEREGRYRRLCGCPRHDIEKCSDVDKRHLLVGYDRSEEEWQASGLLVMMR